MVDFGKGKKPSPPISFAQLVGQPQLKTALLAIATNDHLTGLLIKGEKGTAKSTAVRALADLLPHQQAIADCPYHCPPSQPANQCSDCQTKTNPPTEERPVPLVTLPLGATRDNIVGTLSVADALAGDHSFDPGLLARANRGFLYVDEVNLLDDHLVDVLLDAAASGINHVERDGVSITHPANFTLIGTMNPEEGDLRPQLRDRFDLQTTVTSCQDIDDRVTIINNALNTTTDQTTDNPTDYREQLTQARDRLPDIDLPPEYKTEIAELCLAADVDGHRADITIARTAPTLAALAGRTTVIETDIRQAAELALPHRLQSKPFEDAPDPDQILDDHFDDPDTTQENSEPDEPDGADNADGEDTESDQSDIDTSEPTDQPSPPPDPPSPDEEDASSAPEPAGEQPAERRSADSSEQETEAAPLMPGQSTAEPGEAAQLDIEVSHTSGEGPEGTRADAAPTPGRTGPRVRTERTASLSSVDPAASIRAAATRGSTDVGARDLRQSIRAGHQSTLVVFAVDASASMRGPMRTAKGVALELLKDAYEQRDEVALVTFAGQEAEVVLPPTDSVTLAARHLKTLPTGDRTPLAAGLRTAGEVVSRADPHAGIVILVSDGRANAETQPTDATRAAASALAEQGIHVVVVDASSAGDHSGLTTDIVQITDGVQIPLSALSADRVEQAVRTARADLA